MKMTFQKQSLSRILQSFYIKEMKLKVEGDVMEFGATEGSKKSFANFLIGDFKLDFADKISGKNVDIIDFEKKNEIRKSYDLIVIFNVLEHIFLVENAFEELKKLLKKDGKIIGATPFLYRVHYAPEDYSRYTKQFYEKMLDNKLMKNIKIEELGFGPFTTCYSILFDYIKLIPFLSNIIITVCLVLDKILGLFVKTPLKQVYPISYVFYCEN